VEAWCTALFHPRRLLELHLSSSSHAVKDWPAAAAAVIAVVALAWAPAATVLAVTVLGSQGCMYPQLPAFLQLAGIVTQAMADEVAAQQVAGLNEHLLAAQTLVI